jgi:hypothetical protein
MSFSVNHKIICKPYKGDRKPEAVVKSGLATVKQKTAVHALEVLVDARINDQLTIKAGSFVNLHEEILFARQGTMKHLESPAIGEPFVFVEFGDVLFVSDKK